jgi:hypothetical protein
MSWKSMGKRKLNKTQAIEQLNEQAEHAIIYLITEVNRKALTEIQNITEVNQAAAVFAIQEGMNEIERDLSNFLRERGLETRFFHFLNFLRQIDREITAAAQHQAVELGFGDSKKPRPAKKPAPDYLNETMGSIKSQIAQVYQKIIDEREFEKVRQQSRAAAKAQNVARKQEMKQKKKDSLLWDELSAFGEDTPLYIKAHNWVHDRTNPPESAKNKLKIAAFRAQMTKEQAELLKYIITPDEELKLFRHFSQDYVHNIRQSERQSEYNHAKAAVVAYLNLIKNIPKKQIPTLGEPRFKVLRFFIEIDIRENEEWLRRLDAKYQNVAMRNPRESPVNPAEINTQIKQYEVLRDYYTRTKEDKKILRYIKTRGKDEQKAIETKEKAEKQAKEEDERKAKEEAARKAKEDKEKIAKEEIDKRAKAEADKKAKLEAEKKAKEDADRKAKEDKQKLAQEEIDKKAKAEADKKAKLEAEKKAKEDAERKTKEDKEKHAKEEIDKKTKAEAEKKAKLEAEKKAKEDTERKTKEDKQKLAKEEIDKKAKAEAEKKAKEETDRKAKEETDRKAKEEADRKAKEEADRKAKEEADRKAKEEADRKAKEEAEARAQADKVPVVAAPTTPDRSSGIEIIRAEVAKKLEAINSNTKLTQEQRTKKLLELDRWKAEKEIEILTAGTGASEVQKTPEELAAEEEARLREERQAILDAQAKKPRMRALRSNDIDEIWTFYFLHTFNHPTPDEFYGNGNAKQLVQQMLQQISIIYDKINSSKVFIEKIPGNARLYYVGDSSFQDSDKLMRFFQPKIFEAQAMDTPLRIIFLGNYTGHNHMDLHNLLYVMCFNLAYPREVIMLRGQNEEISMAEKNGLAENIKKHFGQEILEEFYTFFAKLPVAHYIDSEYKKIFTVHGGVPVKPEEPIKAYPIRTLTFRSFKENLVDMDSISQQFLYNQSAPKLPRGAHIKELQGGVGYSYGQRVFTEFTRKNKIDLFVSGSKTIKEGYSMEFKNKLLNIFSNSEAGGQLINSKIVEVRFPKDPEYPEYEYDDDGEGEEEGEGEGEEEEEEEEIEELEGDDEDEGTGLQQRVDDNEEITEPVVSVLDIENL